MIIFNFRFQRDSFITSNEGRLALAEQQQSRDTQFNLMQDDSITERTQLNTSNYNPATFTDSNNSTGTSGNGNSNGDAGRGGQEGRITDNGIPPTMATDQGIQMHNLGGAGGNTSSNNNGNNRNGNDITNLAGEGDEDVNDALVGNDHRNVEITLGNIQSSKTTNNGGLNNINMNLLNRFRRTVRYLRSGRGSNLNDSSAGVALNPKV